MFAPLLNSSTVTALDFRYRLQNFSAATLKDFKPAKDGYEEWRVEFEFNAYLGESVWDDEGIVPQTVYLSYSPLIGAAHEADYEEVTDEPTVGGREDAEFELP